MNRSERGAATAELMTALPLLVVVTWVLVWLVSLGAHQTRLVDAARETARALARGEPEAAALSRGSAVGPPGTTIVITRDGSVLHVEAQAEVRAPLTTFGLTVAHHHAQAVTEVEPCAAAC